MRPSVALADRVRRDGASPLVTFYDDDTGERIELSALTAVNWVAKLTHLLVDELWLDPGFEAGLDLPVHWQTAVITLAVWSAGGVPRVGRHDGAVVFTTPGGESLGEHTVVCSLRALGGRVLEPLPHGWRDFATDVPVQPDAFAPVPAATDVTKPTDLPRQSRVLSTVFDTDLALLAPLACGGSVVMVRHPRTDLTELAVSERATCTVGVNIPGLARLDH